MTLTAFGFSGIAQEPLMFKASQELMDLLLLNGFREVESQGGLGRRAVRYQQGNTYCFRKNGQCTVHFLKDGRVHVLNGPIAIWNLHDSLRPEEVDLLMGFASMPEDMQDLMRNYMGPRCTTYMAVYRELPGFQVDWKTSFLCAMNQVKSEMAHAS